MSGSRISLKQTVYMTSEMQDEIREEARRQGRPVGWLVRKAVMIAMPRIKEFNKEGL